MHIHLLDKYLQQYHAPVVFPTVFVGLTGCVENAGVFYAKVPPLPSRIYQHFSTGYSQALSARKYRGFTPCGHAGPCLSRLGRKSRVIHRDFSKNSRYDHSPESPRALGLFTAQPTPTMPIEKKIFASRTAAPLPPSPLPNVRPHPHHFDSEYGGVMGEAWVRSQGLRFFCGTTDSVEAVPSTSKVLSAFGIFRDADVGFQRSPPHSKARCSAATTRSCCASVRP